MKTINLRDYGKLPIMYDNDGDFKKMGLDIGDYFIMREPENDPVKGSVISVYEIIRLTETGHESKITMLRID